MYVDSYSCAVPSCRVQREQIIAKQQEEETARLKNSGKTPKGSKDGLRPESPHSRRPRRPPVRKIVQANKTRFEVCRLFPPFLFQVLDVQRAQYCNFIECYKLYSLLSPFVDYLTIKVITLHTNSKFQDSKVTAVTQYCESAKKN